ncbi:DUF934 domain-containing protein [Niveibacterium sp. 24ML]|uniref:DUF934 domain-containing protein n=1 Tax=Niveibacterium sp. 24ML TaxID=2985512 RepID=UPI00226F6AAA|nr:DUF934 domain-containing protein [Niveibacterium sp. 24ML]MCX9157736.1 DUF934 domain-containing protein [Niveibacterium sp. 24ML]
MSNLIKNGAIVADTWTLVPYPAIDETVQKQAGKVVQFKVTGTEAASPELIAQVQIPAGQVIVPLTVFRARKDELAPRIAAGEIGVWLESFELVEDLVASIDDINTLPLIAYDFPKFVDGRGFSAATLLRTRYGYKNELRAIGDVLRDKLYFMKRCGFDAYQIRADRSAEDALASLRDFSEPYQGAVDEPLPVWRRHARA